MVWGLGARVIREGTMLQGGFSGFEVWGLGLPDGFSGVGSHQTPE